MNNKKGGKYEWPHGYELLQNEKLSSIKRAALHKADKYTRLAVHTGGNRFNSLMVAITNTVRTFSRLIKQSTVKFRKKVLSEGMYTRKQVNNMWSDEPVCTTGCRTRKCLKARVSIQGK